MKDFDIPPFYVGQEVVANKNHSQGLFKKGDEFIVTSIDRCACGQCLVTVGLRYPSGYSGYFICQTNGHRRYIGQMGYSLFHSNSFSPKIEISEFISMKQLAEQQLEVIGAN